MAHLDLDKDGVVSAEDIEKSKNIAQMEDAQRKHLAQLRLARYSLVFMAVYTLLLFAPFVDDKRVELLTSVSELLYISLASIVGAYMGFTSWASRK